MASGGTVLVVEDDPAIRLLCRINLEFAGHRVLEAGTLAEAAPLIASERPSVVLLDIHVGNEDGTTLVPVIRESLPASTIALFSGSPGPEPHDSDVDAVITKPFSLDLLVTTVNELVEKARV